MRTSVVTGLLGSGKTTFIRNLLKARTERTVVLVNDFGQAGIDGEIFSAGGIESVELPSGCVCCTLRFDLISTIQRIVKEFAPVHLVIEPSGIASPSGVLEALESAGVGTASVVGIVDATEFADLYEAGMYGNFFREQVEASEVILVNKTDIADEVAITAAEQLISSINPHALLFRTIGAALPLPLQGKLTPEQLDGGAGVRGGTELPRPLRERDGVRGDPSWQEKHVSFETHSFKLRQGHSPASLRTLFHGLAEGRYGTVLRAKALVQTSEGPYRFDIVYGKVDEARFERNIADSRLVVIGEGLDGEKIGNAITSSVSDRG